MTWYKRLAAIVVGLIFALLVVVAVLFVVKASESRRSDIPGMEQGRLMPCPSSPNCVSSEYGEDQQHSIDPLDLDIEDPKSMQRIQSALVNMGAIIMVAEPDYLSATFTSKVFGFVDDLEIRLDRSAGVFQLRAASRVGHNDMNVNKTRVTELRKLLK